MIRLFSIILISFFFVLSNLSFASSPFSVAMVSLPESLETTEVNSVTEYVLLEHLLRPLVSYSTEGQIVGDLAASWEVSDGHKRYIIQLKENQHFSDGALITADDVVATFKRSIKKEQTVHFDFEKIKEVKKLSILRLEIILNKADPFFLIDLDHPEFRILSREDATAEKKHQTFSKTSGPYRVEKKENGKISFLKNSHYPKHFGPERFIAIDNEQVLKNISRDLSVDVLWGSLSASKKDHDHLLKNKYRSHNPRLGFSFFLGINPNRPQLADLSVRQYLQNILRLSKNDIPADLYYLEKADQVYLAGGPGRLNQKEVEAIRTKAAAVKKPDNLPKSLVLLISARFPLEKVLVDKLSKVGIQVVVKKYKDFSEYAELIKDPSLFDLIQVNNDFSSLDLRGSLEVTFNESRPLLLIDKGEKGLKAQNLLNSISNTLDDKKRFNFIHELGQIVLEEAWVVPLYYYNTLVYVREGIDLSNLSSIVPDVSIWKMKPSKH